MKYYVYGLIDPRNAEIKYIGKGTRYRMYEHVRLTKLGHFDCNNFSKFKGINEILSEGYSDLNYIKLFETNLESEAYAKEIELIIEYHTHISENGWNCTWGGESPPKCVKGQGLGRKHSEETKKKISEALKGRIFSDQHIQKMTEARHNRSPVSEETKEKMSLYAKNRPEAHSQKIASAVKGRKHSEETKRKMSESHKGKKYRKQGTD